MEQITQNNKIKSLLYTFAGISGISLVIIIHEMGHFITAQLCGVTIPTFSIGFGPTIFSVPIGETTFQIAALPLGGYVTMDPKSLADQSYVAKMLIISAGIIFNLIFAYGIFIYYALRNQLPFQTESEPNSLKNALKKSHAHSSATISSIKTHATHTLTQKNQPSGIIGPIGIINVIGKSLAISTRSFWLMIGVVSLNIGLFNLLPLPFFDGGQALMITIETLSGKTISPKIASYISLFFLGLFLLFMGTVSKNDVKRLLKK